MSSWWIYIVWVRRCRQPVAAQTPLVCSIPLGPHRALLLRRLACSEISSVDENARKLATYLLLSMEPSLFAIRLRSLSRRLTE